MTRSTLVIGLLSAAAASSVASAQSVIYATGQMRVPGDPSLPSSESGHHDSQKPYVFEIDVLTGLATAVSPVTLGLPAALAGSPSDGLYGFASGQLSVVDPTSGTLTSIGSNNGLSSTAMDITADNKGFVLPFDAEFTTQQIHAIDLSTGSATPIGSARAIGDAIDLARGTPLGSAEPYIISLGSIGSRLYGIDLDTDSLVSIDSTNGAARVVGEIGAVGMANGGGYSGFSALTGVDEDLDGEFDALFGSVNQLNNGDGPQTIGGIARFDLTTGEWSLVGTNPGILFYGFGLAPAEATGCNAADLAEPYGELNLFDILAFLQMFSDAAAAADINRDARHNVFDILLYLDAFGHGCG